MTVALQGLEGAGPSGGLAAVLLVGRIFFAAIFILSGVAHLTRVPAMSQYAAAFRVPQPTIAVFVTGLMILAGGLSILLGMWVRVGALLLVVFLIPAAIYMHPFWGVPDPMQTANQRAHFMKNLSLAGAALMIYVIATLYPHAWAFPFAR